MAMVLKNNKLATMSLGELNKNIVEKGKRMTRLASGQKIVGASDGASEFSITEKMQVQLRSLGQNIENTRTGHSLLSVGAGGIEKIVEELRGMKELAINAANDTNTDADRATLQKEFDQKKQDIADIVATTNYNGKLLLDGTYARKHSGMIQTGGSSGGTVSPYGPRGAQGAVTRPFTGAERTWPGTDTSTAVTIDEGGSYTIPSNFHGTVTISNLAAAAGIMLSGESALTNVNIVVDDTATGADLWINGLTITNSTDTSIIQFTGSDNTLTLLGNSTLTQNTSGATQAVVDMGSGLTVQGNGSTLTVNNYGSTYGSTYGACIGTDAGSTSSGNLLVENANLTLNSYQGSSLGSGANGGSVGNITIDNSTVNVTGHYFSGIGSGCGSSSCGDIVIRQSTINDLNGHESDNGRMLGSIDTCIGSGYSGSSCGNITLDSTIVNGANRDSPLVGAGNVSTCGNIYVSNTDVIGYSTGGAGIGSGIGGVAGDIYIRNETKVQHESPYGAAIGAGQDGTVGTIYISRSSLDLLDATNAYSDSTHIIPGIGRGAGDSTAGTLSIEELEDDPPQDPGEIVPFDFQGTPLIIHTGTKANQHMRCYIEDLGLKALGIEDAEVTTQEKATKLLGNPRDPNEVGILDKAINYALGEATQIGAYMSRLEQTQATLTVNQENTTAAESTIRDADMAVEMTAMVKANILSQSSQAMLAQANQVSSSVLDLLG